MAGPRDAEVVCRGMIEAAERLEFIFRKATSGLSKPRVAFFLARLPTIVHRRTTPTSMPKLSQENFGMAYEAGSFFLRYI
jgi:hypothetical protein